VKILRPLCWIGLHVWDQIPPIPVWKTVYKYFECRNCPKRKSIPDRTKEVGWELHGWGADYPYVDLYWDRWLRGNE